MTYEKLNQFIIYIRWMQERELDVLTNSTAPKGFGKSSAGIQFSRKYVSLFNLICNNCKHQWTTTKQVIGGGNYGQLSIIKDIRQPCPKCSSSDVSRVEDIDFDKYLVYDSDELYDMIFDVPEFSPILPDEGARFMMAEDWMKTENKRMKKLIAQMRTKWLVVFTNIQKFKWTDKKIKDVMTTFWVRILCRGLAIILEPDLGERDDPWHMKKFEELLGSYNYRTPKEELLKRAQRLFDKHPCVFDYFFIPKVPDEIYAKYKAARDKKVFQRRFKEESIDQKEVAKIAVWNLINRWHEIKGAVKMSRFDRPTYKMLEEFVFSDPKSNEHILAFTTIRNWQTDINRIVNQKVKG